MTVVASLLCDGYTLIASDTQITESDGVKYQRTKLAFRSDIPLAWGIAGDEGLGAQFSDWMKAQPPDSFPIAATLLDLATAEVARINGKRRAMNKLANVETGKNDLFDVLIVGFLGGAPFTIEMDSRGVSTDVTKTERLSAVGSGKPHVKIAHMTVSNIKGLTDAPDANLLGFLMEVAANSAHDCSLPLKMLKVAPDGVSEVTQKPKQ
jgi:hypothetical protein